MNSLLKRIEEFNEKIPQSKALFIYAGIIGCWILLLFYFAILPKQKEYRELNNECEILQARLKSMRNKAVGLPQKEAEFEKAEKLFKNTASQVLSGKDKLAGFINGISKSAGDAGLDFLVFNPKTEIRKGFLMEIPISVTLRGNYNKAGDFFEKISNLPGIVNITDINMYSENRRGGLIINCTIAAYRL